MTQATPEKKAQIVYFSHGGGPMPILGDASHQAMIDFMTALPGQLHRPDAIVVVSAHWEARNPTLMGAEKPGMFYDYYGFPDEAYTITYPAPGNPDLARRIALMLAGNQIEAEIDDERGFDHGLFIPLKMMYPQADIPALQLSILRSLNPIEHIALGKALRGLLGENILIIGSGFSFHNLGAFFGPYGVGAPDPANESFQDWLIETCTGTLPEDQRERRLVQWSGVPHARYCHPREDHLLPLHVCYGLAGGPGKLIFNDQILGKRSIGLLW